jgi:hypothetical protein
MAKKKQVKTVKPAKPKGEPKFWILWAPDSHRPPKVRFGTLAHVEEVANIMVNKYHQDIYVMQSVQLHRMGKPEVVTYTAKAVPKKVEKIEPRHPKPFRGAIIPPPLANHGHSWTQDQDDSLIALWAFGARDVEELARRTGRSPRSIEYRLDALGLRPRSSQYD